ncbi:MAG: hypothetical protein HRT35_23965 [Algicola sp.]|nr:hypothetical protein [Algicola sp.]
MTTAQNNNPQGIAKFNDLTTTYSLDIKKLEAVIIVTYLEHQIGHVVCGVDTAQLKIDVAEAAGSIDFTVDFNEPAIKYSYEIDVFGKEVAKDSKTIKI